MIYLDYSSTTKVDDEVLESFIIVAKNYYGNANSIHEFGNTSNKLLKKAEESILNTLHLNKHEVIFTSSATESNNTVLKGLENFNRNEILIGKFEHSSISETVKHLNNKYVIKYLDINNDGTINIEKLKKVLNKNTLLVSFASVDSELGIKQDVENITKIIKENSSALVHIDAVQALGKVNINYNNCDFISGVSHKFYGVIGTAFLIKKKNIKITPLLHGGTSHNEYRSSTVNLPGIVSTSKALRLATLNIDEKYKYVDSLNKKIKNELKKYENIVINNTIKSIAHIINFSILNIKPESFVNAMSEKEIYLSTKSACSNDKLISSSVLNLYNDKKRSSTSIRISLSYKTTEKEIDKFLNIFRKIIKEMSLNNER
ncbi:MAG: cysteine desulfurase family protein [Bacilli bacterium]